MARNRYAGLARLGTHPAFRWEAVALVCPICGAVYTRVSDYDRDFLAHGPDARTAFRWLSGRRYDREAPKREWPDGETALREFGDDTVER